MTETWNSDIPKAANVILADVADINEDLTYLYHRMGYMVDSSESDQGAEGSGRSLKDIVDTIGTAKTATIFFPHLSEDGDTTTYTLSTTESIPSNITLEFQPGAIIADDANNASLTISGGIRAGLEQQIFEPW